MSDEYQYQSLKLREICVIELYPPLRDSQDDIQLYLSHLSIDDEVHYSALSYAWGDPSRCRHVICDGKRLPVTESLFLALTGIRAKFLEVVSDGQDAVSVPSPTRFLLWADAICIDQSNKEELSAQVLLMSRIYSQAYGVLAWLGGDNEGMNEALRLIQDLRVFLRAVADAEESDRPDVVKRVYHTPWSKEAWTAFEKLFTGQSYFSRTWVVQEMALARRCLLLIGADTVPWEWLEEAVHGCHYFAQYVADPFIRFYQVHQLEIVRRQVEKGYPRRELSMLLFRFRMWQSSDPRDKVYALLGLSDSHYVDEIIPSYTTSVTEVFQRVCRVILTKEDGLELLSAVPPHPTEGFNLPSWVPDWTRFLNRLTAAGPEAFDASGGRKPQITASLDESALILKGHKLSALQSIGLTHPAPHGHWFETSETARYVYSEWFETVLALHTYPTGETVLQALALALLGGRKATTWPMVQEDINRAVQQLLKIGWILFPLVGRPPALIDDDVDIVDFLHQMEAVTPYRRMAVTEDGYIGLVPDSAEVGDIVCLLYGGRTPYVLRNRKREPNGREADEWKFVGECYIHGLMFGEGMTRPEIVEQDFVIR